MTALVTLAELQAHLNNTDSGSASDLQYTLDNALSNIESELGRPLATRAVTEYHTGFGVMSLTLRQMPCPCSACQPYRSVTITSVTLNGATLDSSLYRLRADTGLLYRNSGLVPWYTVYPDGIVVVYSTGYTTSPPWLRQAVLLEARRLWEARRGRSARQQVYTGPDAPVVQDVSVKRILDGHRISGF